MYVDNAPCSVCGSEIRLEPHGEEPRHGKSPDGTLDLRVCTDPDCPTNTSSTVGDGPHP